MRKLLLPLFVLATAFTAACSSSDSADDPSLADGTDQEQAGATKLTEAKLYADANANPNPMCDSHTALTVLKARSGKLIIELENRLSGSCEIFVAPDKRSYTVTESESCGSKILKGTKNGDSVELQDNRSRMCEDIRPAILELKEKRGGRDIALYGKPLASQQPGGGGAAQQVFQVKMYDQPHAQVNAGCDKHTELTLTKEGSTMKARLEYKLSATSGCEIFIQPNEKIFTVTQSDDGCGSKVYSGSAGGERLKIQDHSTRLCENVIPARIEAEWTRSGQTEHLYTAE